MQIIFQNILLLFDQVTLQVCTTVRVRDRAYKDITVQEQHVHQMKLNAVRFYPPISKTFPAQIITEKT